MSGSLFLPKARSCSVAIRLILITFHPNSARLRRLLLPQFVHQRTPSTLRRQSFE